MTTRRALALLLLSLLGAACATAPRAMTVATPNGSIFVDDGGRGTQLPIVFVHGNGGSSSEWRAQLAHFRSAGRRAVAIDLPGFGASSLPANGDYSLEAMTDALDAAMDRIGLRRFVIVGHSYGGAVVAKYAAAHPQKVAGVVYVDAAAARVPLTEEQKVKVGAAMRADKMKVVRTWFAPMLAPSTDAVRQEVLGSVEKTPVDAFLSAFLSLTEYDAKTLVAAYQGPRLAIVAADIETPMSFQKQFPEIRSVPFRGVGHWLMLDDPEALNRALDAFLETVGR